MMDSSGEATFCGPSTNLEYDGEVNPSIKVDAIVPAAGRGERMQNEIPKQYLQVCGVPLVVHCLTALSKPTWIRRVVFVVDDEQKAREILSAENLPKVIAVEAKEKGSRHRSIVEGLNYLQCDPPDIVVIHDGVRPIVPMDILTQVTMKAHEVGAAGAVRPLVSTVVRPDAYNRLESCLQRSSYRNSEMPQAFAYKMILQAYKECSKEELDYGTECLAIAQKYGKIRAHLVEGTADLWKVTHPEDIKVARSALPKYCLRTCILFSGCSSSIQGEGCQSITFPNDLAIPTSCLETGSIPLVSFLQHLKSKRNLCLTNEIRGHIEGEGPILLCENEVSVVSLISQHLLRNSLTTEVITSTTLPLVGYNSLISVSCPSDLPDAIKMLHSVMTRTQNLGKCGIIAILSIKGSQAQEEELLSLGKTASSLFPREKPCLIIVLRSSTVYQNTGYSLENSQHDSLGQKQSQLSSMLDQCMKLDNYLKALHGQVLYF